jgi:mutator protein MutT
LGGIPTILVGEQPSTNKATDQCKMTTDVGVAVIERENGDVLIDRREETSVLGGLWEFPGGKVELRETIEECIHREIMEEVGISISIRNLVGQIEHEYPHGKVRLHVYMCKYINGHPEPRRCEELKWIRLVDSPDYNFVEADKQIVDVLKK